MSEPNSFLPSYDFSPELNAKYLRKILQLMVQHQVPATPVNYAIWYDFVSENNTDLIAAVNHMIEEKIPFDLNASLELYRKYVCNISLNSFEKINEQIQKIITQTSVSLELTHGKADQAQDYFEKKSVLLEDAVDIDAKELNATLQSIIQETKSLAQVTIAMQTKLDITNQELLDIRQELVQVRRVAITDALTGLFNRRAFDETLVDLFSRGESKNICLCMLDIDHFKRVNDSYGHIVGDNVIRFVATIMKNNAKVHHYTARYGGEEMAIIMPDTSNEEAYEIAEKIRVTVEKSILKRKDNSEPLGKITVSIGIAQLMEQDSVEAFVARADKALYKAKGAGRNKVLLAELE